jgi:hypothetical protein
MLACDVAFLVIGRIVRPSHRRDCTRSAGPITEYHSVLWSDHLTFDTVAHMAYPNTLIFVDCPSSEPTASAQFYAAVFGSEVEPRKGGDSPELPEGFTGE